MNRLMLVVAVAVNAISFFGEIYCLVVHNNTPDAFDLVSHATDYYVKTSVDDIDYRECGGTKMSGNAKLFFSFGSLPDKSPPETDEPPSVFFKNENAEFQIILKQGDTRLLSDTATELHNSAKKDGYAYGYIGDYGLPYLGGLIINRMIVGPYRVVYCYEKHGRGRIFVVEYAADDDSWMENLHEEQHPFLNGELPKRLMDRMIADGRIKIDPEPTCCSWFCCRRKKK